MEETLRQHTTQDCGNIVQWEHINLDISDSDTTFYFYFQALGLTLDPYLPSQFYNRVYWANIGEQQLHLVRWDQAQVIKGGNIVLQVPSLEELETRLVAAESKLKGTRFEWHKEQEGHGELAIHVTCPWGNNFTVVQGDRIPSSLCSRVPLTPYPWKLGLCSLILECAKGSAKKIAKFFRNVLFARVVETETSAVVFLGPRQSVVFEESEHRKLPQCVPGRKEDPSYPDYHLCVYIAEFQKGKSCIQESNLSMIHA